MTNEQILKQAIEKAKDNGWETNIISVNPGYESILSIFSHSFAKHFWGEEWSYKLQCPKCKDTYNIFDDEENWGPNIKYCGQDAAELKKVKDYLAQSWRHNLTEMVLEEDPIQYLKKFI